MATTTSRLSLRKPATTDAVDVSADIDANMDKVDAAVGFEPLTAFPGSPYTGKGVLRTDLANQAYWWDGAAWWAIPQFLFARKTSNQNVNNSTTIVDISQLNLTIPANTTWVFRAYIIATSVTGTPNMQFTISFTGSPTGFSWKPFGAGSLPPASDNTTIRQIDTNGSRTLGLIGGTDLVIDSPGWVVNAGSSCTITWRYAQSTATAENTTVKANSWVMAERVA